MKTVTDLLASLGLNQYQNNFLLTEFLTVSDLLRLSDSQLEVEFERLGVTFDHSQAILRALSALRTQPSSPFHIKAANPHAFSTAPAEDCEALQEEVGRMVGKLEEINEIRQILSKSKRNILALDVQKYRDVLDRLEDMQRKFISQDQSARTTLRAGKSSQ